MSALRLIPAPGGSESMLTTIERVAIVIAAQAAVVVALYGSAGAGLVPRSVMIAYAIWGVTLLPHALKTPASAPVLGRLKGPAPCEPNHDCLEAVIVQIPGGLAHLQSQTELVAAPRRDPLAADARRR